jgi:hypothetical protein
MFIIGGGGGKPPLPVIPENGGGGGGPPLPLIFGNGGGGGGGMRPGKMIDLDFSFSKRQAGGGIKISKSKRSK